MKRILQIIPLVFAVLYFSPAVSAQTANGQGPTTLPLQNINLKDGTVIKGRLVGVSGNHYIIQTTNLGQVEVKISDLETISNNDASKALLQNYTSPNSSPTAGNLSANPQQVQGQVDQMRQKLLADPQINADMQEIIKDPEVMSLLQDKNLLQAAMTMDPQQIQNNPGVQKLLQNPKMQVLMDKVRQKMVPQQNNLSH